MNIYPNPRKAPSVRRLGAVDFAPLRDAVLAIPESLWEHENADKPNRFETLDKTQHIVFRFVDKMKDWRGSYDRPIWAEWKALLLPVMEAAVRDYGYSSGEFPRVMFARMAPGGVIKPHVDGSISAMWPHKIHVPLVTNPGVRFYIKPQWHHFPVGEAVEVNNLTDHAVENTGNSERIHLIFEYFDADQPSFLDGVPLFQGPSLI